MADSFELKISEAVLIIQDTRGITQIDIPGIFNGILALLVLLVKVILWGVYLTYDFTKFVLIALKMGTILLVSFIWAISRGRFYNGL